MPREGRPSDNQGILQSTTWQFFCPSSYCSTVRCGVVWCAFFMFLSELPATFCRPRKFFTVGPSSGKNVAISHELRRWGLRDQRSGVRRDIRQTTLSTTDVGRKGPRGQNFARSRWVRVGSVRSGSVILARPPPISFRRIATANRKPPTPIIN